MRTLATNEKHLLLLLCGALFVAANMVGLRSFLKAKEGLRKAMIAATSDVASDKSWIDMGSALSPADAWINTHPMPRCARVDASAQLLKSERDAAEQAGLKITEENLLPSSETQYGSTVAVSVRLAGPFQGVVRMLFALQTPTAWRTVSKLSLKSDAQPPNVVASLELVQYFQSPGAPEHPSK
jgi:hypothetical protein